MGMESEIMKKWWVGIWSGGPGCLRADKESVGHARESRVGESWAFFGQLHEVNPNRSLFISLLYSKDKKGRENKSSVRNFRGKIDRSLLPPKD